MTNPEILELVTTMLDAGYTVTINLREPVPTPAPEPTPDPAPKPTPNRSLDDVARAVYRGEYGNGLERIRRLSAEGWDPAKVQERLNTLFY